MAAHNDFYLTMRNLVAKSFVVVDEGGIGPQTTFERMEDDVQEDYLDALKQDVEKAFGQLHCPRPSLKETLETWLRRVQKWLQSDSQKLRCFAA